LHVDPDIMLVDEVLSVGDYEFQKRCLDGIDEMARQGCTIVFVSHDLYAVRQTCRRVIFLSHGEVQHDGDPQEAVNLYMDKTRTMETSLGGTTPSGRGVRWGSYDAVIEEARLLDAQGQPMEELPCGDPFTVEMHYYAPKPIPFPGFMLQVKRNDGLMICGSQASFEELKLPEISGRGIVRARMVHFDAAPGSYMVSLGLTDSSCVALLDFHGDAYPFKVTTTRKGEGLICFPVRWDAGG